MLNKRDEKGQGLVYAKKDVSWGLIVILVSQRSSLTNGVAGNVKINF